jgi:hypothetical protein
MEKDKKNIKIIFNVEGLDTSTTVPTPSCLIFYTKNTILHHLNILIPASTLKGNGCFTVYGFLEKNFDYLYTLLEDNSETTTSEIIEDTFKNKEIFKSIKNKIITILRKQKINNFLS